MQYQVFQGQSTKHRLSINHSIHSFFILLPEIHAIREEASLLKQSIETVNHLVGVSVEKNLSIRNSFPTDMRCSTYTLAVIYCHVLYFLSSWKRLRFYSGNSGFEVSGRPGL